jgi:enoyl-CoA hydratase/carnithine racemase
MKERQIGSGTFKLARDGQVARIILNRPEVLNAGNCVWMDDFHLALDEVEEAGSALRIVILSGEGRSFSTGIDLKALATGEIKIDWFRRWEHAMRRIEALEAITIAKVHGYTIGGGLQIALACDLRIAAENSKLGLPAVLEALIPGLGTFRLPRFIGLGRAKRMILTGELLSARQAEEIGLVDWVADDNELDQFTDQIAADLLKGSPKAQCFSKRLTFGAFEKDAEEIAELYADYQSQTIESPEHKAAMNQYLKQKGLI